MLLRRFVLPNLTFLLLAAPAVHSAQKITFPAREGKILTAQWTPPKEGETGVLVCLHGLQSAKEEWAPLAAKAVSAGWGVLAYDARGHGESSSTHGREGQATELFRFGPPRKNSPWEKMIDDAGAAVLFVKKELKDVKPSIFLVGASLGANVALNYSSFSRSVEGAILLSPGLDYQGIRSDTALGRMPSGVPLLAVVSEADRYAYQSCESMKKYFPALDLWTDVNPGHGVQMVDEKLLTRLMAWLEKHK